MPATLTPTRTPPQIRAHLSVAGLLRGWHLLSLDAPTVAAVWTVFFARSGHCIVPTSELIALFIAVWLLYVADRLLDAGSTGQVGFDLQPRHIFHYEHRRALLVAAAAATAVLIPLTVRLPGRDLRVDLMLAAALALWFLLIHKIAPARALPKELTTGVFFAAATLVPTFTRHPAGALIPEVLTFAALCTLNGLYITTWESRTNSGLRVGSIRWATIALGAGAAGVSVLTGHPLLLAVALAAAGLLLLDVARPRLHPTTLRAAADFVLLTPVLLWPFVR